jgi:peptide chain release factor 2
LNDLCSALCGWRAWSLAFFPVPFRKITDADEPVPQKLATKPHDSVMKPPKEPLESIPIPDSDQELLAQCRVETFTAGGKGGQHQNRSETGVRLTHLPTGVVAVAREERSQHRNRATALARLREKLQARARKPEPRIPTRVPGREKAKRLEEKRRRGTTKRLRRDPVDDPDG